MTDNGEFPYDMAANHVQPGENYRRHSWEVFRETGMLWAANRTLHVFGWAVVVVTDESGVAIDVYPARTEYRGFSPKSDARGFQRVAAWVERAADALHIEARDPECVVQSAPPTQAMCVHAYKGGPCALNPTVPRAKWCAPCVRAVKALSAKKSIQL